MQAVLRPGVEAAQALQADRQETDGDRTAIDDTLTQRVIGDDFVTVVSDKDIQGFQGLSSFDGAKVAFRPDQRSSSAATSEITGFQASRSA